MVGEKASIVPCSGTVSVYKRGAMRGDYYLGNCERCERWKGRDYPGNNYRAVRAVEYPAARVPRVYPQLSFSFPPVSALILLPAYRVPMGREPGRAGIPP